MNKLKYLVPNAFTGCSLVIGLVSVTRSAAGDYELAAWMILWGVLLDKLDGSAARLFKATSSFGVEFDSFADFVAFGIAPAALVFYAPSATGAVSGVYGAVVVASACAWVLATAGRLARFNTQTLALGDRYFYGLPTTLVGAVVAGSYLTLSKYALVADVLPWAPALLFAGAALMLSRILLPKLKVRRSLVVNVAQFGAVGAAYVLGPLRLLPELLLALGLTYVIVGLGHAFLRPPRAEEGAAPVPAAATPRPAPSSTRLRKDSAVVRRKA